MSKLSQTEQSITRVQIQRYSWEIKRSERICLIGLLGAEVSDPTVEDKRRAIVERLVDGPIFREAVMECTIGGCDVVVEQNREGKSVKGTCKATDYCLKQKFEEAGDHSHNRDKKRELHKDIMDTCLGFAGEMSAGEFCPKLECGLSAGFSIDGIPGTAGKCYDEINANQTKLDLDT